MLVVSGQRTQVVGVLDEVRRRRLVSFAHTQSSRRKRDFPPQNRFFALELHQHVLVSPTFLLIINCECLIPEERFFICPIFCWTSPRLAISFFSSNPKFCSKNPCRCSNSRPSEILFLCLGPSTGVFAKSDWGYSRPPPTFEGSGKSRLCDRVSISSSAIDCGRRCSSLLPAPVSPLRTPFSKVRCVSHLWLMRPLVCSSRESGPPTALQLLILYSPSKPLFSARADFPQASPSLRRTSAISRSERNNLSTFEDRVMNSSTCRSSFFTRRWCYRPTSNQTSASDPSIRSCLKWLFPKGLSTSSFTGSAPLLPPALGATPRRSALAQTSTGEPTLVVVDLVQVKVGHVQLGQAALQLGPLARVPLDSVEERLRLVQNIFSLRPNVLARVRQFSARQVFFVGALGLFSESLLL